MNKSVLHYLTIVGFLFCFSNNYAQEKTKVKVSAKTAPSTTKYTRSTTKVTQSAANPTYLFMSAENLNFDYQGGQTKVELKTNASSWEVTNVPLWCSVTRDSSYFLIVCTENTDTVSRAASVTVKAEDESKIITILQEKAKEVYLMVSPNRIDIDHKGGTKLIYVETNIESWDIECPEWCKYESAAERPHSDRETRYVTISCQKNDQATARSGEIVFKTNNKYGKSVKRSVVIQQEANDNIIFKIKQKIRKK